MWHDHREKQHIRDKNRLDGRKQAQPLEEGDRVLVKNTETGGPGKLRSFWEDKVYEVVNHRSMNVYEVRKIGEPISKTRTLHRNMLMCCNSLPLQENEVQEIAEKSASTVEDGSNNRKESTAIGKKKQFNSHH